MPKISVKEGITLPIPNQQYSSVRPEIGFYDIDTDGDVDAQLAACRAAAEKVAAAVEDDVAQEAANLTGLNFEGRGVAARVVKLEELVEKVVKEVRRQKELTEK